MSGLFLELGGLIVGAAESEQGDDVGLRQRRLGAIVHVETVIGRAGEGDVEVVVANVRGGLEIELGFDRNGIGECDVAALEGEMNSVDGGAAFENVNASENRGAGDGAADAKVGIAGEAGDGGSHLEFGSGLDVDIELDVEQWRIRGVMLVT